MATYKSDLTVKSIRHRSTHEGIVDSVTGRYRLNPGTSLTTADLFQMVPLGENVRPLRIILSYKEVSGTPVLTGGSFSIGVAPETAVTVRRADGTEFAPLTAAATKYSAAADLGAASQVNVAVTTAPSDDTKWGPFYVTLTPTEATSVAGGSLDINLTVEFAAEKEEAEPVYTEFLVNGGQSSND
jgi:hypothetical protein